VEKKAKTGADKEAKAQLTVIDKVLPLLREGKSARLAQITLEETPIFLGLQLLTAKPILYACNVDEASAGPGNALSKAVEEKAKAEGAGCVVISAKIESEFAGLAPEECAEFLKELGLDEPGLNRLIREGYKL